MSRISFAVLAGMATILLTTPAFADPPVAATNATVPAGDRVDPAQTRRELAPLAGVFGVKNPDDQPADTNSASSNDPSAQSADHKTLGDVADRGLTMLQDLTGKIADSLSKIAPQVWRIMIKQQIAKAIVAPLGPLAWIVGAWVLWGFGKKIWKHMEDADYDVSGDWNTAAINNAIRTGAIYALPLVVAVWNTIGLVGALSYSVLHLVNPEFYAIQDLLNAIMTGTPPS